MKTVRVHWVSLLVHSVFKDSCNLLERFDLMSYFVSSLYFLQCKLENVSDEERQVVSMYKNVVDAWLSKYIKIQRRKCPQVTQAQSLVL